jgi:putative transcriptional regulator
MILGMSQLAPCLLVASPLLLDPNFLHSVVLLVEHDEQGGMGVILNRPLPVTLQQICQESHLAFDGDDEATAWRGGPVDPQRGIILVRGGLPDSEDTVLDFTDFISYRKDLLESLLMEPSATFRLFLGYAGWGAGQLDNEIQEGAWVRMPLNPDWLMPEDPQELWSRAISAISG